MGRVRRQLTPSGFSVPLAASSTCTARSVIPVIPAAVPAGAFHTPRLLSVLAQTPATAPHGPSCMTCLLIWSVYSKLG
jgi:hypothetical protein